MQAKAAEASRPTEATIAITITSFLIFLPPFTLVIFLV
jgi:hypothetical protein